MTYWAGKIEDCQWCGIPLIVTFVDGRIPAMGIWGCLCETCVRKLGVQIGTGKGQRYTKQPDGRWLKTEG